VALRSRLGSNDFTGAPLADVILIGADADGAIALDQ
jgi:hypothetical protein